MNDSELKAILKRLDHYETAVRHLAHETSVLASQVASGKPAEEIKETSDRLRKLAKVLTGGLGGAEDD